MELAESERNAVADDLNTVAHRSRVDERTVYRLRDLDRRARWLAILFGIALCLAPLFAFVWAAPDWTPTGDPALMGIRALDVGTSRTPLVGQPSSGSFYVDADEPIHHPGPAHFYLLAGPVRLFGAIGMALVSVLIVGACLLISAWAVFRQLGASAGMVAAVVLGAITFTTGASTLIDPVSSRMAGYPLLCSAVLLWCLMVGDLRLLPLATLVVSFTAQQHLSVGPAIAVLTVGAVACLVGWLVVRRRLRSPQVRRDLVWGSRWSALVAFVMWAPVLVDQVSGEGNLGRLVEYAGSREQETLGVRSAVRQVVHVLGLPPLLGRTDFSGSWIISKPSLFTHVSAIAVVGVIVALGVHWWRADRRKFGLTVMAGIAALAGLVNGSSVPLGFGEEMRSAFYHWAFVLAFFAFLVIGLGIVGALSSARNPWREHATPVLASLALAAIVLPSVVNPTLDRPSNTLDQTHAFWRSERFDQLSDAVMSHRDVLGSQPVLIGGSVWTTLREALAFELDRRGLDVRHSRDMLGFVHDDRLVDRETVTSGLVLQPFGQKDPDVRPPGKELAVMHLERGTDPHAAFTFGTVSFRLYLLDREQLLDFAKPGVLTPDG